MERQLVVVLTNLRREINRNRCTLLFGLNGKIGNWKFVLRKMHFLYCQTVSGRFWKNLNKRISSEFAQIWISDVDGIDQLGCGNGFLNCVEGILSRYTRQVQKVSDVW